MGHNRRLMPTFRAISVDAEAQGEQLLIHSIRLEVLFQMRQDPRVTRAEARPSHHRRPPAAGTPPLPVVGGSMADDFA